MFARPIERCLPALGSGPRSPRTEHDSPVGALTATLRPDYFPHWAGEVDGRLDLSVALTAVTLQHVGYQLQKALIQSCVVARRGARRNIRLLATEVAILPRSHSTAQATGASLAAKGLPAL